jgi:hypothetical protein
VYTNTFCVLHANIMHTHYAQQTASENVFHLSSALMFQPIPIAARRQAQVYLLVANW